MSKHSIIGISKQEYKKDAQKGQTVFKWKCDTCGNVTDQVYTNANCYVCTHKKLLKELKEEKLRLEYGI